MLLAAMAAGAGCAHDEGLIPAPQAATTPGRPRLAYDQAEGVAVFVDGDAWKGAPRDLEDVMAPLWVTVQNHGKEPVRLLYRDFTLELPSGLRVTPLPPFAINTPGPTRVRAITQPAFFASGFYLSPVYGGFYPGMRVWYRPLPLDPFFYDTYHARWRVPLPTEDMLRSALPEGVLSPGGSVSGFLYFPDIPADAKGNFTFRASLAEEKDGTTYASVDIPLRPK
jgi:hypothetical protein